MAIKKVRMKPPGYTDIVHPETSADVVIEDASHRFVTDTEKSTWNAKETPAGAQAKVDTHNALKTNPHAVTKAQVGLGNVDNTSDSAKPVSTAQQTALNLKADKTVAQMFKITGDDGLTKGIIANCETVVEHGVYLIDVTTLNRPSGLNYGILEVIRRNRGEIYQRATSMTGIQYIRVNSGSGYIPWIEIGRYTDGIVESGSNPNGSYIKFGDGTLLCWGTYTKASTNTGTAWGSMVYAEQYTITYPSTFYATPALSASIVGQSESVIVTSNQYTTYFTAYGLRPVGFTAGNYMIKFIALGRWKA